MPIKKYVIAITLCVAVAGAGILALAPKTASAQSAAVGASELSIEQLQQMVQSLQQMIAQIMQILSAQQAQRQTAMPVCGNGKCETGETAIGCPQDCGSAKTCYGVGEGQAGDTAGPALSCCPGLVSEARSCNTDGSNACVQEGFICELPATSSVCGNGKCEAGETIYNCPQDCSNYCDTACQEQGYQKSTTDCSSPAVGEKFDTSIAGTCCCVGEHVLTTCGNGTCDFGETNQTCPQDCSGATGQYKNNCSSDSDCVSDGGTCHECLNKTWFNALSSGYKKINFVCEGIGDSLCKCQGGTCAVSSICGDGTCDTGLGETATNCPADCSTTGCVREGQYVIATTLPGVNSTPVGPQSCCAGLTMYTRGGNESVQNGVCVPFQHPGMVGSYLCVKCGDGICNAAAGENVCNCPQDCKK